MNDDEALRLRFDSLPKRHVFSVEDVEMVPAVLGRLVDYSWSARGDTLTSLEAHGKKIATVGDLRRLLKENTEKKMTIVRAVVDPMFESAFRGLAQALDPMRLEITDARMRARVLFEMLEQRDPSFHVEFAKRFREAVERDAPALFDQTFAVESYAYQAKHGDWLASEETRLRETLGDEAYEKTHAEGKAWRDRLKRLSADAAAEATARSRHRSSP